MTISQRHPKICRKKENKGKVIILEKAYDVVRYDVVGGTFMPSEEPEETEE